ncbi:hypothetical protein AB4120_16440 [Cupriavidus sp. 2KB_3]|uniref:hypothetical protein n=1 Tax=Cupriavidus sp. 2KB_3 TaxID=3232980 RepID=UPI003F8EE62C
MTWPIPAFAPIATPGLPRARLWLALLVLFLAAGALATAWLWPEGRPASGLRFWLGIAGIPALAWMAAFGVRLLVYGNASGKATLMTSIQEHSLTQWRAWGNQRLVVLDVVLMLPDTRRLSEADLIHDMIVDAPRLEPSPGVPRQIQDLDKRDPFSVREKGLFILLLQEVRGSAYNVHAGVKGSVEIVGVSMTDHATTNAGPQMAELLDGASLDPFHGEPPKEAVDASVIGLFAHWSTEAPKRCGLFMATQLWGDGDEGTVSEGGVGMTLATDITARAAGAAPAAWLRRPMQTSLENLETDLETLLGTQGPVPPLARWWLCGLDTNATNRLLAHPLVRLKLEVLPENPNQAISIDTFSGPCGGLCEWQALAAACIAAELQQTAQFFAARNRNGIVMGRIDPPEPSAETP